MISVSFPGIGITLEISRVAFYVFKMPVYWYGLIIALGFVAGITVASFAAKKLGENSDVALDLAIYCGPVGIVCARLYYVIFKLEDYISQPMEIFNFRGGGLAIYGGIIGAVGAAVVYSKIKKKSVLKMADIGSVGLITGQMIGRWGNFFNQEAFGSNTMLPWGMISEKTSEYLSTLKADGVNVDPFLPVHPTFLYESLWSLMTLAVLWIIIKHYRYNGQVFFAYGALYGLGRLWIEALRTDSLMLGAFRVSQLIAILSFAVFGFLYVLFLYRKNNKKQS